MGEEGLINGVWVWDTDPLTDMRVGCNGVNPGCRCLFGIIPGTLLLLQLEKSQARVGPQWERISIVWSQLSTAILKIIHASRLHWLFQACQWSVDFLPFSRIKRIICKITQWHRFPLERRLGLNLLWIQVNFVYSILIYLWSCSPTPACFCPSQLVIRNHTWQITDVELKVPAEASVFHIPSPHRQILCYQSPPNALWHFTSDVSLFLWSLCAGR